MLLQCLLYFSCFCSLCKRFSSRNQTFPFVPRHGASAFIHSPSHTPIINWERSDCTLVLSDVFIDWRHCLFALAHVLYFCVCHAAICVLFFSPAFFAIRWMEKFKWILNRSVRLSGSAFQRIIVAVVVVTFYNFLVTTWRLAIHHCCSIHQTLTLNRCELWSGNSIYDNNKFQARLEGLPFDCS